MKKQKKHTSVITWLACGSLAMSAALTGCGGSESTEGGASSDVTVSGSFGTVTGGLVKGLLSPEAAALNRLLVGQAPFANRSVNIADYSLYCVTLSVPPASGKGSIGATGSFSVTVAGAKGKKMGCFVVDANDDVKATLVIKNSSEKDMNGNAKTSDSSAFNGNANLGSITLDLDKGEAVVEASQITTDSGGSVLAESSAVVDAPFDPTGTWQIGNVDFALPAGYEGPCAGQNCEGPPSGMNLYMKRIQGVSTADASKSVYGLMLWESKSAFETGCGGKFGMTDAEFKDKGVDLSSYGSALSAFPFSSSVTVNSTTYTFINGTHWQISGATSNYEMKDCQNIDVTVGGKAYHAWRCKDSTNNTYQINLAGGCVNAAGTPVQPDPSSNWSGMTCNSTALSGGYQRNTCTGSLNVNSVSTAVTCTNDYGIFTDAAGTTAGGTFNWANVNTVVAQGGACSGIADDLQKQRCYADYYYQNLGDKSGNSSSACLPRLRTNWSTNVAADFAREDWKPSSLIFMEKLDYADNNNASLRNEEEDYRGVAIDGGKQWINCVVHSVGSLSITKVSDTEMLATFTESNTTSSTDQPACVAAYGNTQKKFMFKMTYVSP